MYELKSCTSLIGARSTDSGYPLPVYDDGDGPLWLFGEEYGATMLVRASSFEAAWGIVIDESRTIDPSEVPEAFGYEGEDAQARLDADLREARDGRGEWPDLIDGYEYQSNSSGTGIVSVSYYAWLREFTREDLADYRLIVRSDECERTRVQVRMHSYAYSVRVDDGAWTRHRSYALISDVGAMVRQLDREWLAVDVGVEWVRGE